MWVGVQQHKARDSTRSLRADEGCLHSGAGPLLETTSCASEALTSRAGRSGLILPRISGDGPKFSARRGQTVDPTGDWQTDGASPRRCLLSYASASAGTANGLVLQVVFKPPPTASSPHSHPQGAAAGPHSAKY